MVCMRRNHSMRILTCLVLLSSLCPTVALSLSKNIHSRFPRSKNVRQLHPYTLIQSRYGEFACRQSFSPRASKNAFRKSQLTLGMSLDNNDNNIVTSSIITEDSDSTSNPNQNGSLLDLDTFRQYNALHQTLRHLQAVLPSILYKPIKESNEEDENGKGREGDLKFYDPNFQLVAKAEEEKDDDDNNNNNNNNNKAEKERVNQNDKQNIKQKEIILLSSRDELETLSSSLALATSIAKRASDFFYSAVSARDVDSSSSSFSVELPTVNCSFYLQFPQHLISNDTIISQDDDTYQIQLNASSSSSSSNMKFKSLYVHWSTSLPSLLSDTVFTNNNIQAPPINLKPPKISGISKLIFNNITFQISKHQLIEVEVDDRVVPITTTAEVLLRLKRFAQSPTATAASSIFSANPPIPPLLKELRDGLMGPLLQSTPFQTAPSSSSQPSSFSSKKTIPTPPIYLLTKDGNSLFKDKVFIKTISADININDTSIIPISDVSILLSSQEDPYVNTYLPFPGSKAWSKFASFYKHITQYFIPNVIPLLSSNTQRNTIASLLRPNISFQGMDGSTILSSSDEVAQFYTTLSMLRRAVSSLPGTSSGSTKTPSVSHWDVKNVTILPNKDGQYKQVLVSWKSTLPMLLPLPLPDMGENGSKTNSKKDKIESRRSSLIPIEGQDLFTLERIYDSIDENINVDIGNDYNDLNAGENQYLITAIQQKELVLNGNSIDNPDAWKTMVNTISQMDGQKFVTNMSGGSGSSSGRAILTAMELLTDIWDLTTPTTTASRPIPLAAKETAVSKKLSTEAAASVFYFMTALHSDLRSLIMKSSSSMSTGLNNKVVPAEEFLTENIKIRGFLKETLSRDIIAYRQVIGFSLASLRTAIRFDRIIVETDKEIITKVELTPNGDVQLKVILPLWVKSLIDFDSLRFASSNEVPSGVPLKIELLSVYKVNADGMVYEHRLLESRVNGVLTPADVVSRWVQRMINSSEGEGFGKQNAFGSDVFDIPNMLDNPLLSALFDAVDRRRSMNK